MATALSRLRASRIGNLGYVSYIFDSQMQSWIYGAISSLAENASVKCIIRDNTAVYKLWNFPVLKSSPKRRHIIIPHFICRSCHCFCVHDPLVDNADNVCALFTSQRNRLHYKRRYTRILVTPRKEYNLMLPTNKHCPINDKYSTTSLTRRVTG